MASSSAIGPGPSDIGFGADPAVRNLAPRWFEGKDRLGETVGTPQPCVETVVGNVPLRSCERHDLSGETVEAPPHFCTDSVGEKDTPRPLERDDLSEETSGALSRSRLNLVALNVHSCGDTVAESTFPRPVERDGFPDPVVLESMDLSGKHRFTPL